MARRRRWAAAARRAQALLPLLAVLVALLTLGVRQNAHALAMCGNPVPTNRPAIRHVIVVLMENRSYGQVIGHPSAAPYENSLASQCGLATKAFGATHTSAANYLAVSAGRYPANAPKGCGTVAACTDTSTTLFGQLRNAGFTWKTYAESATSKCQKNSAGYYKIGHNPPLFYPSLTGCGSYDLPVADLTQRSGAFYNDLTHGTLPSFAFVSPNVMHDGDKSSLATGDAFLGKLVPLITSSAAYQSGSTVVLVTYDEGAGGTVGQDCTNKTADLGGSQESCHVPLFVVYPYTPAGSRDSTFFDHYTLTRFVEDVYDLPYLGHAADSRTNSLAGHFSLLGSS